LGLSSALIEFLLSEVVMFISRFFILCIFMLFLGYDPGYTWIVALLISIVMFSFSFCISIYASLLGVYFRDFSRIFGHIVWLWWYLSPGLYRVESLPEWAQLILAANPFTYILPVAHSALLKNEFRSDLLFSNFIILIISILLIAIGLRYIFKMGYKLSKYV